MARRNSNKLQPAVMTFTYQMPIGSGTDINTIDLSQCASLLNRRFYRQGMNWAVSSIKILSGSTTTGSVVVKKLPNTWVTSNAWEKSFRAWNRQQMEAIQDSVSEDAVARFRDFKVHADTEHVTAGFGSNLLPIVSDSNGNPIPFNPGEWEHSQIVIPNLIADASGSLVDPKEYALHMVGPNNFGSLSKGILEGYADSRAFPQSPDPVSPAIYSDQNWLRNMFDVGNDTSEITENATDRNDDLPYPQVDYPGGETQAPELQIHDVEYITGTTVGGTTRLKGGNFPCGLIRLQTSSNEATALSVVIDMVPGEHRGYLCEPMTEM